MDVGAVQDPLRFPLQNGGAVVTAKELPNSTTDESFLSRTNARRDLPQQPNTSSAKPTVSPRTSEALQPDQVLASATSPAKTSSSMLSSTLSSPRAHVSPRDDSSSSTHPSNLTVLNINSSSSVTHKQYTSNPAAGMRSSSSTQNGSTTGQNFHSTASTRGRDQEIKSRGPAMSAKSDSAKISDFASSLTSALLETKELDTVDLHGPDSPVVKQQMFNDLSFKPSSPCDDDLESTGTCRAPSLTKRFSRRLPKTPAPSMDLGGPLNIQSIKEMDQQRMSLNLRSLDFSLPISEVYEPEPVDFPSSPGALRSSDGGVRLATEEEEREDFTPRAEDYDSGCLYTAEATPPTGRVAMRKTQHAPIMQQGQQHQQAQQHQNQIQQNSSKQQQPSQPHRRKKLSVNEDLLSLNNDEDQPSIASLDDDDDVYDDDAEMLSHDDVHAMLTPDDVNTPDELEESIMERLGPETPVHTAREGQRDGGPPSSRSDRGDDTSFRAVVIQGIERRIDMQVIEPYKKVLSHGGHLMSGEAIIVFSACFLPDRARHDYDYVMDHLFMYVLTTLDQLIAEDYVLVYLHGATTRANMPSFNWLKRCYQMIDRRLRKNLQALYLVHPTFWVKTVVVMIRPFVSAKFSRKLRFVTSLQDLANLIPMEQVCIPSRIKQYDDIRESLLNKDKEQLSTK